MSIDRDEARATYEAQGYWVSPVLFDGDEVARFIAATQRVVDGVYTLDREPTLSLPASPKDHDLRKIDNAWWADPDLAALATDATVGRTRGAAAGCGVRPAVAGPAVVQAAGRTDHDDDRLASGLGELGHRRITRRVRHRVGRLRRRG